MTEALPDDVEHVDSVQPGPATRPIPGRISDSSVRAAVTISLVVLFALTNLGIVALVSIFQLRHEDWKPVTEVADLLLPTQGALIGSAIGFYFADSRRNS